MNEFPILDKNQSTETTQQEADQSSEASLVEGSIAEPAEIHLALLVERDAKRINLTSAGMTIQLRISETGSV